MLRPNRWKGLPRPEPPAMRRPARQCQNGKCEPSSTHSEKEVQNHFVRWHRSRQERLCGPRRERIWQARVGTHQRCPGQAARDDRSLPPCTIGIGIEACSGVHHWARLFTLHGHTVRLMAPKFVVPYRLSGKRGKNDACDAAAICEAVQRPNMRFVPIKTLDQQSRLLVGQ